MSFIDSFSGKTAALVEGSLFKRTVIGIILFSAVLLGFETSPNLMKEHGTLLHKLDKIIVGFFVVEIVLKILAQGRTPFRYFKDSWNVIDFIIVAGCLIPAGSNTMAIFRLVRVFRIFRLITALPKLQIVVSTLLKSIPSIGYVVILLSIHFYMFAILGVFLFAKNDPLHFGSLGLAFLSLFQVLTLEGWVDIMRIQIYGCAEFGYETMQNLCVSNQPQPVAGVLYFITFIVMGTMIILNLLIGVMVSGMSESHAEITNKQTSNEQARALVELTNEIRALRAEIKTSSLQQLREK